MSDTNIVFLPWARQGAASTIATVDTLNANLRGAAELTAALAINGQPLSVPVRLRGPADVLGIDPREIVRTDPKPNTSDFEPNYFATIEFDRPDFPWLFTPAKAGTNQRLRPWLCLVVVEKRDGVSISNGIDSPLPVLSTPVDELPDLSESWAWAHTQVSGTQAEVQAALRGTSDRSLSRLIAPRILQPHTEYIACVVPTFELGRKAGLGLEIKEAEIVSPNALQPAWTSDTAATVTLPVYYHWEFRTGKDEDFESLVRLLQARPVPEGLGRRTIDISKPGFPIDPAPSHATLDLEGALRPMTTTELAPWPEGVETPFKTALASILNVPGENETANPEDDPILGPPLYGRWHAARSTVPSQDKPWFDELNLDPRHRSVAAYGTRVIQEHQEELMAAAWERTGSLESVNQRLRQLQLSLFIGASLHSRHFSRMRPDEAVRVAAPAFARLRSEVAGNTLTIAGRLAQASLPVQQAASTAMRRIARERGPITRRARSLGVSRTANTSWVSVLGTMKSLDFIVETLPDTATFHAIRQRIGQPNALRTYADVNANTVAQMKGRPTFQIAAEGERVVVPPVGNDPPDTDSPTAKNFREAAKAHLARIRPERLGVIFAPVPPQSLETLRDNAIAQLDPKRTFVALAQAVIKTGESATPPVKPNDPVPIEPIMDAPKFPWPMYEPLRDLAPQLLLPGIEKIEPNTVLGLQTNRRFVDAYMVGLNFEMGRELLWRGYPTDQRGTCFERFWDTRGAANVPRDVENIHMWGARRLGGDEDSTSDRFVMLMRSDLLRRYPSAVIYAVKATLTDGVRKPSSDAKDEHYPIFRGSMDPDITFFGFELTVDEVLGRTPAGSLGYFIVIQEQPGEPRFGFDIGTTVGTNTYLKLSDGVPSGHEMEPNLIWGHNGAHMAAILRQLPVRVAIHASQFMPEPQPA